MFECVATSMTASVKSGRVSEAARLASSGSQTKLSGRSSTRSSTRSSRSNLSGRDSPSSQPKFGQRPNPLEVGSSRPIPAPTDVTALLPALSHYLCFCANSICVRENHIAVESLRYIARKSANQPRTTQIEISLADMNPPCKDGGNACSISSHPLPFPPGLHQR